MDARCGYCRESIDSILPRCSKCNQVLDRILVRNDRNRDTFKALINGEYLTLGEISKKYKVSRRAIDHRFHKRKWNGVDLIRPPMSNSQAAKVSRLKALEHRKEFRISGVVGDRLDDPEFRQSLIDRLKHEIAR